MLKKFLWLVVAVVFLCSPLWANNDNPWNEYLFAVNDQAPQGVQPLITALKGPVSASPLDLCPNTNTCVRLDSILPCTLPGPLGIGMAIYSFQDPANACPPPATCPTYPFEVKAVHVVLTNCQAAPCVATLKPSILSAIYPTDPNCPVPGNMLCQGPEITATIQPNQCLEYVLPIKETCCVNEPYFASVEILTTGCGMLEVCTDRSCDTCCNYVRPPGGNPTEACAAGAPGDFALWTDGVLSCQNICPKVPADTGKNHYKTWSVTQMTLGIKRLVKDQFMSDSLFVQQLEFLSNPVRKIVFGPIVNDTFKIIDPDDHLTWYRVTGRDTLLKVTYKNQFESTSVCIDSAKYLLLPAQKDGHLPPDSVDHYKAYRIQNPPLVNLGVQLEDQFDRLMGTQENVTSFRPVFFLTPCQKNNEPTYDTATHYVAYEIAPIKNYVGPPRQVTDQFLFQKTIDVFSSRYLLVPTQKLTVQLCQIPPPVDTLRNHFKTWRVFSPPKDTFALVRDQFTIHDFLFVDSLTFLSNPVRKIVSVPPITDTFDITRPDDHLSWYRVKNSNHRRINVQVTYVNQFESTKVFIDTVKYLLLPTQKLLPPHPAPDSLLGHYTAYRIHKPKTIKRPVQLDDQFDATPEPIDSLVPRYFLTPADKNNELRPKSDTHYVAYEIFPKTPISAFPTTQTIDQWGGHAMQVRNSEYLLVPSRKDTFVVCTYKPNDCNGDGNINLTDIICDVNVVFHGFPKPIPNCRCDSNCDNKCDLVDIVMKKNYVFGGGPPPIPCKECCIPVK